MAGNVFVDAAITERTARRTSELISQFKRNRKAEIKLNLFIYSVGWKQAKKKQTGIHKNDLGRYLR